MSVINLVYSSGPIAENCGNEWYCCVLVLSTMNTVVIVVMILMVVTTTTTMMMSGIAMAKCTPMFLRPNLPLRQPRPLHP